MPACARKEIVRQGQYGIFHVSNRVVRRAFLLGRDPLSGNDYHHRRQWVIQRLELLVANFAIDVCFLALLANHIHLVLRTTPRLVKRMGSWEVARRWLRLYPGRRVLDGSSVEPTEELLPMSLDDYLQLLDWTGRQVREDKRGAIPADLASILERLGIVPEEFVETVTTFSRRFRRLAGPVEQLAARAKEVGRGWLHGVRHAARVFR